ncbi:hypothetical protein Tco_0992556 [Tanacetum coccineum]|uniref:Uncharacterized protein n=1 Tax=Tanacetum coccineum TaxID=301880 RepID=A0ABQ5F3X9_9ASTR
MIFEPSVLTLILETPSVAPATTLLPPSSVSTIPPVLLQTTTPIPTPPITTEALSITMILDPLHADIQRVYFLEKYVQDLKEANNTTTLRVSLRSKMSPAVNAYLRSSLGDALQKVLQKHTKELIQKYPHLDDAIASGQPNLEKVLRKREHDDKDPSAGLNQDKKTKRSRTKEPEPSKKSSTYKESSKGKYLAKTSKSGKSMTVEEPVEMASEDIKQIVDDVVTDADQILYDSTQTKDKAPKKDWFKQHLRPPTPDQEWNNCQVNNPEVDRCPFDLTKPLPLKGRPGRLTVTAEYFFNNDLEFIKSSDPEKKYTTSITKTKAARYEIVGIKDMVLTLWSTTKVGYDKDALKGIKHWRDKRQHWYRSQTYPGIEFKELYTPSFDPPWIIYEDLNKQKRVMRADELYKFSDRTLKTVHDELHHPMDKRRLGLMVELINKKMLEMRIIRNLERLVGAWELEMDYKLMTRTEWSSSPISNLIL